MGMGMIFENGYGCGYSSTRPVPAPRSSLDEIENGVKRLMSMDEGIRDKSQGDKLQR